MKLRDLLILFLSSFLTTHIWASTVPLSAQIDLNNDDVMENIALRFDAPNESKEYRATLLIESNGQTYSKFLGDWFSPDLTQLSTLIIGQGVDPFVVVDAATGAHSENRKIFRFDGKSIEMILDVTSDAPSIEEKDRDGDGILEVIVKRRDYDRDPAIDSREVAYKWDGTRFIEVK